MNNNFKNNPLLNGISPEKLDTLSNILKNAEGKNNQELISYFMNSAASAGQDGISFSDSETQTIINAIKANLSPEAKKKIDNIYEMSRKLSKKQANS